MTSFRLPDLGEGLEEAEIVAWHVAQGDHVVADQPLVSVETDKAVVEIPAPQAGVIARLQGDPGDIVKVGDVLVEFEAGAHADAGAVVGEIPAPPPPAARVKSAPAVRALAAKLKVDLAAITGSGPDGTITRADVEAAAPEAAGEPLRGARRAMARNMARAHAEVVPATVHDTADVDAWMTPEADVTGRLIRAIIRGAAAEPALNAWFDGERLTREAHETVDLGLAVDTREGLVVPMLRDVGGMTAAALRAAVERAKTAAAERRLAPDDLGRPTITLSNFGLLAGRHAAMVVMPPQVAILGAGRIGPQVAAVGGRPAVRLMLPLSLTFDHRAVTGGEAARFLAVVIADLECAA